VLEIEGARLVEPWGWIVGPDDHLLGDHTWFARQLDKPYFKRLWEASRSAETSPRPGTTLSLLTDSSATNYAHFLLDALARLANVAAAGIDAATVDRIHSRAKTVLDLNGFAKRMESLYADAIAGRARRP
jgi:hypothetical protein